MMHYNICVETWYVILVPSRHIFKIIKQSNHLILQISFQFCTNKHNLGFTLCSEVNASRYLVEISFHVCQLDR